MKIVPAQFNAIKAMDAIVDGDLLAKLSCVELKVLLVYLRHADADGEAFPGPTHIAKKLGHTDPKHVRKARRKLRESGLLKATGKGPKGVIRYTINLGPNPPQGENGPRAESGREVGPDSAPVPRAESAPQRNPQRNTRRNPAALQAADYFSDEGKKVWAKLKSLKVSSRKATEIVARGVTEMHVDGALAQVRDGTNVQNGIGLLIHKLLEDDLADLAAATGPDADGIWGPNSRRVDPGNPYTDAPYTEGVALSEACRLSVRGGFITVEEADKRIADDGTEDEQRQWADVRRDLLNEQHRKANGVMVGDARGRPKFNTQPMTPGTFPSARRTQPDD